MRRGRLCRSHAAAGDAPCNTHSRADADGGSAALGELQQAAAGQPGRGLPIEPSDYQTIVDRSIRTLQAEQPAIFEGDQVLSVGQYYVGLIKVLDRQGICAVFDGEELAVTDRPTSNEQFHVLTSASRARFGPQSYRTTCSPSVVPVVPGALPPAPAGCTLPSSREVACGRENSSRYINDMTAAIEQVLKEKPDLFNYGDTAAGTGWPAVKNLAPTTAPWSRSWSRRATARRTTARRSRSSRARTP